jgi:ABC-type multidrug transport system ATPase subunit
MSSEPVVSVENVRKEFGDGAEEGVLQGVDLDVERNETTLLMGPNGTGKTVLLACIAGGLNPSDGDISVLGDHPRDARSNMNFMIQGGLGIPDLSGRENLEFYSDLHPGATDEWKHIVETMELADDLDRPVRDYSGGMLRKLELAITLSVDTPLYLLDEPSAELDLTTINQFHSLVQNAKDDGKTVVMTSHTPLDAEIADRVVILQHGDIVADDEPGVLVDSVPPVVRVHTASDATSLRDYLRQDQLFESGGSPRGFLKDDVDPDKIEREFDATVEEPDYADMFDYYTRVLPDA